MPLLAKYSDSSIKIIEAATKLFARQGYHGTSTRQIAKLAEVGEVTIFRVFTHKEQLFWATLESQSSGLKMRRDLEEGLLHCDSPQIVLPQIIDLLTDIASYKPDVLKLIAVAFLELNWKAGQFGSDYLSPILVQVNQYLQLNIKAGKLRGANSTILTAALAVTTLAHPEIAKLISGGQPLFRNSQDASHAYARFWLELLSPDGSVYVQGPAHSIADA